MEAPREHVIFGIVPTPVRIVWITATGAIVSEQVIEPPRGLETYP
jgi:hypothetical protein